MKEKGRLGVTLAVIAGLAIGGAFWDKGHKSSHPIPRQERTRIALENQPESRISSSDRRQDQAITKPLLATGNEVAARRPDGDADCFKEEKPSECDNRKIQHEVATFTSWLVWVGFGQAAVSVLMWWIYRSQRNIMAEQLEAAKTAANAALRQANAMVSIESPIVRVGQVKLVSYPSLSQDDLANGVDATGTEIPLFGRVLVGLTNSGRSDAELLTFCLEWRIESTLPTEAEYEPAHIQIYSGRLLYSQRDLIMFFGLDHPNNRVVLTEEQRNRMADGKRLWAYGYISYTNFMAEVFDLGFLAQWRPGRGLEMDESNHHYTYHNKRGKLSAGPTGVHADSRSPSV
jgi:hypothetical protein